MTAWNAPPEAAAPPADWPQRLHGLLQSQRELAVEMAALAERQSSLIRDGLTDELLSLLARRQQIVDQLLARRRELAELTGWLDQRAGELDATTRQRLRDLIAQVTGALEAVASRDREDQQSLRAGCEAVATELSQLDLSRAARAAYTRSAPGFPRSSDPAAARLADRKG
jgi:ABC-type transporter Mla subunit MlaD